MAGNRTFTMIKPDAVKAGHIGAILAKINEAGFRIVAMKLTHLVSRRKPVNSMLFTKNVLFTENWWNSCLQDLSLLQYLKKKMPLKISELLIGATNPCRSSPGYNPCFICHQYRRKCCSRCRF